MCMSSWEGLPLTPVTCGKGRVPVSVAALEGKELDLLSQSCRYTLHQPRAWCTHEMQHPCLDEKSHFLPFCSQEDAHLQNHTPTCAWIHD